MLLGIVGGGLDEFGRLALLLNRGGDYSWNRTAPFSIRKKTVAVPPPPPLPKSKRARRRMKLETPIVSAPPRRRWNFWAWAVGIAFAMFAVRSFCWLLWVDGNNLKIQSPNNLGDLALHITFIKYFANGVALWPDNPIHVFSSLRYPSDLSVRFALLLQHIDLVLALVCPELGRRRLYGFYRWRAFVWRSSFHGGLAGVEFFRTHNSSITGGKIGKSIPLAMFARSAVALSIPALLLLRIHWRRKYYRAARPRARAGRTRACGRMVDLRDDPALTSPFLSLSIVLGFWLLIVTWRC